MGRKPLYSKQFRRKLAREDLECPRCHRRFVTRAGYSRHKFVHINAELEKWMKHYEGKDRYRKFIKGLEPIVRGADSSKVTPAPKAKPKALPIKSKQQVASHLR